MTTERDDAHLPRPVEIESYGRGGFRFVGPTTAYAAMQALGYVDDHLAGCLVVQ